MSCAAAKAFLQRHSWAASRPQVRLGNEATCVRFLARTDSAREAQLTSVTVDGVCDCSFPFGRPKNKKTRVEKVRIYVSGRSGFMGIFFGSSCEVVGSTQGLEKLC